MEPLCISDALELYQTLKPHLPERMDDFAASYVKKTIDSMAAQDERIYLETIMLMTGETEDELETKYEIPEILGLFIDGLVINRIAFLTEFCKGIGL